MSFQRPTRSILISHMITVSHGLLFAGHGSRLRWELRAQQLKIVTPVSKEVIETQKSD